jgi:hypothetical protein
MVPPPEGVWGMPSDLLNTVVGYDPDVQKNRTEARPRWIGRPSASSSRRCGWTRKRPNSMTTGVSDTGSMSAIVANVQELPYFKAMAPPSARFGAPSACPRPPITK